MTLSNDLLTRLETAARRRMAEADTPGLALALTDGERLIHQASYGYSSLAGRAPVQAEQRFEYGSIGKSFSCILLLQLADAGLLDLHAPVAEYLPWFEVQSEFAPITPHHLMTHTAGIINGTDFPADSRFEVWALRATRAINPPGEHFHYSNAGYKALGLLLEQVTGKRYPDLVQERILDPLGMVDTVPAITHATRRQLATGYQYLYDDRPWQRAHGHAPSTWLETDTADGCIAGTAADLATYLRMLMNGGASPGGRILSDTAFELLTTPHAAMPAARLDPEEVDSGGYGYGLYNFFVEGRQHLSHGGGMVGWHTHMLADRASGFGVTVLINGPGQCQPLARYALELLCADAQNAPLPEPPPSAQPEHIDNAIDYAGRYRGADGELEVVNDGNRLRIAWDGEEASLERRDDDAFLTSHQAFELFLLRFERDARGAIVAVSHGGRSWRVQGQSEEERACPDEWRAYPGHYRSHNPWLGNFRVVLRENRLFLITPSGYEEALTLRGDGLLRVGAEPSPEFLSFDTIVDGEAWRANLSGCDYYRFFTP